MKNVTRPITDLTLSTLLTGNWASSPTSFPRFQELAKELRLLIWKEALKFPRIVTISQYSQVMYGPNPFRVKEGLQAMWQVPALLQVNSESRVEAKKGYKQMFAWFRSKTPVYFNPEVDTLCFDEAWATSCMKWYSGTTSEGANEWRVLEQKLRRIIIEDQDIRGDLQPLRCLKKMKNLQTIVLARQDRWCDDPGLQA